MERSPQELNAEMGPDGCRQAFVSPQSRQLMC